jgi:FkbM family methyltransferase
MNRNFTFGWYLPKSDNHFYEYLLKAPEAEGRRIYQYHHIDKCFDYLLQRSRNTAIDIGAHVGFWSFYLCKNFKIVHAFEPVKDFRDCFNLNVKAKNVNLYDYALGSENSFVSMEIDQSNSGKTHIKNQSLADQTPIKKLDDFKFKNVDFIKIDVEGYEEFVIKGGIETLKKNHPLIIVEQKSGADRYGLEKYGAIKELESIGAKIIERVVDDFIIGWP